MLADRPKAAAKSAQLDMFAQKASDDWSDVWEAFLDTAADFYESAMDLGVDQAEEVLGHPVSSATLKRLQKELQARIDQNVQFVRESLRPDVEAGKYDSDDADEQKALNERLDGRLGRYADGIYSTAIRGLTIPVTSETGVLMKWELDPGADHCEDCPSIASDSPYSDPLDKDGENPLPTYPGDGDTDCHGNCRCQIVFDEETWNAYAEAA